MATGSVSLDPRCRKRREISSFIPITRSIRTGDHAWLRPSLSSLLVFLYLHERRDRRRLSPVSRDFGEPDSNAQPAHPARPAAPGDVRGHPEPGPGRGARGLAIPGRPPRRGARGGAHGAGEVGPAVLCEACREPGVALAVFGRL